MKTLIIGATGLLGTALMREWPQKEAAGLGAGDLDIRDLQQARAAVRLAQPEWIVLAAAYTDVDGCETNQELAYAVNRDGAANVAHAAKRHGSRLLAISTDYVFDGRNSAPYESDHPRAPRSVYGRSKAGGE